MAQSIRIDGESGGATVTLAEIAQARYDEEAAGLRRRWPTLRGLRAGALHRAFGGDYIAEYLLWDRGAGTADGQVAARASYESRNGTRWWSADSARTLLTAGPRSNESGFSLTVDAADARPTLITFLGCEPDTQEALLEYLVDASSRFRSLFGGWIGAVLHPAEDGCGVAEYLQFESAEAMQKLQGLPVLAEHMSRLQTFGTMNAAAVLPTEVWSRDGDASTR